ncbi:unnamed protein product, partial [Rotaria sp. Silwood1]
MACDVLLNLCPTCETLGTQHKQKPGVLLCVGCQKHICVEHCVQHRQYLTDLFHNAVANERNALHEKFSEEFGQQWFAYFKIQLEKINKWELDTIELIQQSADCARKELHEAAFKEYENLKQQFSTLTDKIKKLRENENYFENDIDQLTKQFQQLKDNLEHIPIDINISRLPKELVLVQKIVLPPVSLTSSVHYVDQLLTLNKPKKSIGLLPIKLGFMCPIRDLLISFLSKNELPAVNASDGS